MTVIIYFRRNTSSVLVRNPSASNFAAQNES
jgi:hypothetical protein